MNHVVRFVIATQNTERIAHRCSQVKPALACHRRVCGSVGPTPYAAQEQPSLLPHHSERVVGREATSAATGRSVELGEVAAIHLLAEHKAHVITNRLAHRRVVHRMQCMRVVMPVE